MLGCVRMIMGHLLVIMFVILTVFSMNVDMGVGMGVFVDVCYITVTMLVGVDVIMDMGVLQFDGVLYHEVGADDHQKKCKI